MPESIRLNSARDLISKAIETHPKHINLQGRLNLGTLIDDKVAFGPGIHNFSSLDMGAKYLTEQVIPTFLREKRLDDEILLILIPDWKEYTSWKLDNLFLVLEALRYKDEYKDLKFVTVSNGAPIYMEDSLDLYIQ